MNLFFSYNMLVDSAYIITVVDNEKSVELSQRCAKSCDEVKMPYQIWPAYNGMGEGIVPPSHHGGVMNMIKITDHYLTRGEVACALSHISLWARCVELDKPIVILEHDAVMVEPYKHHSIFNSICYLGGNEQVNGGWGIFPTPPHATEGPNYHFICRAHSYAIDPAVAKNMLAHVIKYGINAPLDIMLRADIFPIHQMGVFAHDVREGGTTILGRPRDGRSTERNDNLKI